MASPLSLTLLFSTRACSLGKLAVVHGPLKQEPGGELHQPRRQTHGFGGIGEGAGTRQPAGFAAAVAVEVVGGFLDQRHSFLEQRAERLRPGEPLHKLNRLALRDPALRSLRPFAVHHQPQDPSRNGTKRVYVATSVPPLRRRVMPFGRTQAKKRAAWEKRLS